MASELDMPPVETAPDSSGKPDLGVQRRVLRSFGSAASRPRYMLWEFAYFDIDYRSEFAVIYPTSFTAVASDASRVHFFAEPPRLPAPPYMHDFVRAARDHYLGYFIFRPDTATVGRSLIRPGRQLSWLNQPEDSSRHIRTAVSESIDVLGVPLEATGVPFMQQDGRVLRCANVSAWMCHYSAVMRGVVPRRLTSSFHQADDLGALGFARSYPSDGLSIMALNRILQKTDLAPEVVSNVALLNSRAPRWFDRKSLWQYVEAARSGPDGLGGERVPLTLTSSETPSEKPLGPDERVSLVWAHENLTGTVCRYLNSGFPVVAVRDGDTHMQVITGYIRKSDLRTDKQEAPTVRDSVDEVTTFVVQDDTWGPFRQVWTVDLVDQILSNPEGISFVVPLPAGLWLNGAGAETAGAAILARTAADRVGELDDWLTEERVSKAHAEKTAEMLGELAQATAHDGPGDFGIRTYAAFGRDLKESLFRTVGEASLQVARLLGYISLPRFVWVVEVVDRRLRAEAREHVVAMAVLDATDVINDPGASRVPVTPLLIQLPGQITSLEYASERPTDASPSQPDSDVLSSPPVWVPLRPRAYASSRWAHGREWLTSPRYVAARFKGAVPGPA